jgi:shikimate kinase
MKKIILLGYMGSGKTTIGTNLSKKLNIKSLDLDQFIENRTNLSISEIFKRHGEVYFRKLEHHFFMELMTNSDSMILSLGGGTPCYANNHELLNLENTVSIYLKATIDTLYTRLKNQKRKRPLIASMEKVEMKEFISKHLFERSFYYNKATYSVEIETKSVDTIVTEIALLLA